MTRTVEIVLTALQEELQWQQDLAAVLDQKLEAMKQYDITRLEALTQTEQRLLEGIRLHAVKRNTAVHQALRELLPKQKSRRLSARELAQALSEPLRSRLLVLTGMLREAAEKVQRLNRINAQVTRKMLGHLDHIFRVITTTGSDIGLYSRVGKKTSGEQKRLVDAIA
ncbi:MAG: FlgN protein [Planctomycetes bacterium ADurb.Bin412]|mgnify:FL=1|nr:MAG: FlgN protein [Planctomycetes bacterium ADurb.Bin412]